MRLLVTTPTAILLDVDGVRHVRAEDSTGAFGIQPGHADFLTVLAVSVLTYRDAAGAEHHAAVRGGVLRVHGGDAVEVATSEALLGDDLEALEHAATAHYRAEADAEKAARSRAQQLHLLAMRSIHRYVHGERDGGTHLPLGHGNGEGAA